MYRIFALLLVLGLAIPSMAAAGDNLKTIAKAIRDGTMNEGKQTTVIQGEEGRFHNIHNDIGLDCYSSHTGSAYQKDFLFLRKGEILPKDARGQADRAVCLGCHQKGGVGQTWYVGRSAQ